MATYSLKSNIEAYRINRMLGFPRLLCIVLFFHEHFRERNMRNMLRLSSFLIRRFYPNWPRAGEESDLPIEEQTSFFWRRKENTHERAEGTMRSAPLKEPLNSGQGGFAFVMNIASLEAESYELTPRCVLRRASDREIELIKERLAPFSPIEQMLGFSTWEKKLGAAPGRIEKLPPADWRYFVIKYEGTNAEVEDLQAASCLATVELEIAFTLIWINSESNAPGMAWHPARLFHTLETARLSHAFFSKVTSADIEQLRSTYTLFRSGDGQTRQMITQLMGLKGFPYDSPLRFLGYFAILESILTHAPKPEDRYDSITRQVKKKLALLDARWSPKIDYSPFGGAGPEKVWSTMYEYRSAIAHGGTADFAGDLRLLKGPVEALTLLKQTVRAVIR